jgi:uncharacterized lipoprotein YehR (DUF1307 family)
MKTLIVFVLALILTTAISGCTRDSSETDKAYEEQELGESTRVESQYTQGLTEEEIEGMLLRQDYQVEIGEMI